MEEKFLRFNPDKSPKKMSLKDLKLFLEYYELLSPNLKEKYMTRLEQVKKRIKKTL